MTRIGYLGLFIALSCGTFAAAAAAKRNDARYSDDLDRENTFEGEDILSPEYWWESKKKPGEVKLIEEEIMKDLSNMDSLRRHKIYDELKRQKVKSLADMDNLSPVNVAELKAVRKSIKTSDIVLPSIRNKRTLNFLLFAVARAMGYILIPRNPDAELLPVRANPCRGSSPKPPPCAPPALSPHHTTPTPPPPTIPPNQIDANTIRYPYRPSQQIPLLQFSPLPPGVNVPYPPLLQWPGTPQNPCSPPTAPPPPCPPPTKPPPPCPPPTKPPLSCPPPMKPPPPCPPPMKPPPPCPPPTKPPPPCPPPTKPPPPCPPPTKPPPPCPPPTKPPPPCPPPTKPPPPKPQPSCRPPPSKAPSPSCKPNLCCTPHPEPEYKAPPPPPKPSPPPSPNSSKHTPLTLEYDYPVKIQIFNNAKKFLPASSTVYSGDPSASKNNSRKLEEYEHLDEQGEKEGYSQLTGSNIFREDGGHMPYEEGSYRDGRDEIREELFGNARGLEDEEEAEEESVREERFYDKRKVPRQNGTIRKGKHNFIEETVKEREYFKTAKVHGEQVPAGEVPQKKIVLKRVIVRKPTARLVDENGNEYAFAASAVHDVRKRDLQDFDFIRKYKETNGEPEDEHYREKETPPGRTTTSIRKIEVKKFIVNKSEDDPVDYHEKTERNSGEKPEKVTAPEWRQPSEGEEEEEEEKGAGGGGGGEGRSSYNSYEPPQYEERREMDNELEKVLENDAEEEEEEQPPKILDHHPPSGRGIKYVTKTVTKYVGRGGGRETVKIVPIYKVVHAPPPRKIIHHHHHRVPVYPRIILKTTGAVKRRPPPVIAHFGNAGNILLVTIRERSG